MFVQPPVRASRAAIFAVLTLLAVSHAHADIIITEVIPGISTSATAGDTVELFNRGPGAVDLTGYVLTDLDPGTSESNVLNEGTFAPGSLSLPLLQPDQFAVVVLVDNATAPTPAFIATNYGFQITVPVTAGSFMAEDFDQLLLTDAAGIPVDFIAWGDSAGTLTGSNLTDAVEDLQALTGPTGGYSLTPGVATWAGPDSVTDLAGYLAISIDMAGFTGVSGFGNGAIRRRSTNGVFQTSSPRGVADFEVVRRADATLGNPSDYVTTAGGLRPIRKTESLAAWVGELNSSTHPERRISRGEDMVSPDFKLASGADQAAWQGLVTGMMAGQWDATFASATALGYEVLEFLDTDSGSTFHILRERWIPGDAQFRGQGTFIFDASPAARQRLVLEAPHTIFDSGTLEQMGLAIATLRPRVAFCAGAHRNNSTVDTTCDGTFAAGQPYRVSDVAHHPDNFFHVTHRLLNDTLPQMIAIQFHGFCCPGSGSYTTLLDDVVASAGDNTSPAGGAFVRQVAAMIEAENFLADGADLTTVAVYPDDTSELGATNNIQGRLSNGVPFGLECTTASAGQTGRFLHLEQDTDVREEPQHIIDAILAALLAEEAASSVSEWTILGAD